MRRTTSGTGRATSWIFAAIAGLWTAEAASAQETRLVATKQVAALPSDVEDGLVRLPEVGSVRERSQAAWWPLELARGEGGSWSALVELPLERTGALALAAVGLGAERWTLELADRRGEWSRLAERVARGEATRRTQELGAELAGASAGAVCDRYDLARVDAGPLRVRVSAPASERAPRGWLFARGEGLARLESWITTPALVGGEPLGFAATLAEAPGARVERATLVLETASGTTRLSLADDGLSGDGAAGDGVHGLLVPGLSGEVRARVEVVARDASGERLVRTSQHALTLVERRALLTGALRTRVVDARRLALELEAFALTPGKLLVAAEVWGRAPSGASVPVTWLARMLEPRADERGRAWLALELDSRWLDRAGVRDGLELRRVRLVDPDTQALFDEAESVLVPRAPLPPLVGRPPQAVTPDLLAAVGAPILVQRVTPSAPAPGAQVANGLMLSHGWCSGGGIWPEADFSAPKLQFVDPDANRSHDAFALLLQQFGASRRSYGLVAHSQGGCAALQLYTFYASGLDLAEGERRIQALATPWQGTPLASFGFFLCGNNSDLTPSGSAAWLANIPSWARAEVHYWTTSNSGSACQGLTDFFLTNPEDGVVEQSRGQLVGGNNRGHVLGWCHSTGMSNPAGYTDSARNAERDATAAR